MFKVIHALRLIVAAAWMLTFYCGAGIAAADTLLRFHFTEGEKLQYECRQTVSNSMTSNDKSMVSTINSSMSITQQVKSVDAEGVAVLAVAINHVKCKIALPTGQTLEYDSAMEEPEDEMVAMIAEQFGQIIDKPIELKIDPLGKISDVKLPEEMKIEENVFRTRRGRAGNRGQAETVVKEEKKEMDDRITDKVKELFGGISFPATAVVVGDIWTATAPIPNIPDLGDGTVSQTFEYKGSESKNGIDLEKIAMTALIKQNIGEHGITRRYVELQDQNIHGNILFDNKAGRVQHSRVKSELTFVRQMANQSLTNTIETEDEFELISKGDEK